MIFKGFDRLLFVKTVAAVITDRCEKKYRRELHWLLFSNRQQLPIMSSCNTVFDTNKVRPHDTDDKPLNLMYISIKSALFRLSSNKHNPSLLSRFSYDKDFNSGNIRVNLWNGVELFPVTLYLLHNAGSTRLSTFWIVSKMWSHHRLVQW